ncbi:MAG: FKBP-type peptidyl-prolyl cis-trans isomerase [Chitinophagaceae bacterium]|nr:FKBP-type peptidyl-prolyl cis-trans isomerase [Chitinophagaceae bacterium]MBK7306235.1 FKBP-type peptidyl-prolyl cis-trans isomerase [Chitinophagaceae bacterium]MBL0201199.1 FKBP-type peptidyl-prolyl cis-trans isomerase [Chitinophagaceae bacterium]
MIRRLIILVSFCGVMLSCKKSDTNNCNFTESTVVVPASEMTSLAAYVAANRPTAVLHPGGFYYEIIAAGTGTVTPQICSDVRVKYAGYLTTGFKFDEELTGITFRLGQLIVGWQRGLPLIKKGGTINLYLPPSLGYGASAVGSIPANSILIFSVELVDVV